MSVSKWTVTIQCAYCGKDVERYVGHVNRSNRLGKLLYCNKECAGLARRIDPEELKRRQSESQKRWRENNAERYLKRKQDYHLRTYDPEKARVERKAKMPKHIEYCRQPEYKEKKRKYDKQYRASEYGPFAEAYQILLELEREIRKAVPDYYERLKLRGYYDKENIQRREKIHASQTI